jgi:hypothetical protein
MEKIKWTDRVTNAEVLARVQEPQRLMNNTRKRKKLVGHLLRHDEM